MNNKDTSNASVPFKIWCALLSLLAVAAIVLRTVAALSGEVEHGFFTERTLADAGGICIIVAVFVALLYLPCCSKDKSYILTHNAASLVWSSGVVAIALVSLALDLFERAAHSTPATLSPAGIYLSYGCALLTPIAIAFFLTQSAAPTAKSKWRALLACLTTLFFGLYVVTLSLDTDLPIHAPTKIADQFAYLAVGLCLLGEARFALDRYLRGYHVVTTLIATLLTGFTAIPAMLAWLIKRQSHALFFSQTVVTLALFFFVFFRLISILRAPARVMSPLVRDLLLNARQASHADDASDATAPSIEDPTASTEQAHPDLPRSAAPTDTQTTAEEDTPPSNHPTEEQT